MYTGHVNTDRPFSPFLVQRLLKPAHDEPAAGVFENPGIFSEETNTALGRLFRLDYMGSAEFEFDTIPRSLKKVWAVRETLRITELSVGIPCPWISAGEEKRLGVKKEDFPTALITTVWVIAPEQTMLAMLAWLVDKEATDTTNRKQEPTMFSDRAYMQAWFALNPDKMPEYETRTNYVGWWALNENCFYFTDKTMFEAVRDLFEMTMYETA